jgi:hypothetical protein
LKWTDTKETPPEHGQEVLVKCDGTIGLAVYDSEKGVFILPNGAQYALRHNVIWSSLTDDPDRSYKL